ncbi:hypothetical protein B0A49_07578 [Cryomyces minteri]|uniref:Uncharacterized protein n=1 Tax=Cryomyces minteri TaxID=331657 RepID=A0A4U0WZ48_9PEZI|nr:hypothetical protein B0A49_07578 [Cryomyces minteri]
MTDEGDNPRDNPVFRNEINTMLQHYLPTSDLDLVEEKIFRMLAKTIEAATEDATALRTQLEETKLDLAAMNEREKAAMKEIQVANKHATEADRRAERADERVERANELAELARQRAEGASKRAEESTKLAFDVIGAMLAQASSRIPLNNVTYVFDPPI